MPFALGGDPGAERLRRSCLTGRTQLVVLSFDRQQRGGDCGWVHASGAPPQAASGEVVIPGDNPSRVEVELGGGIENREVLLVELPGPCSCLVGASGDVGGQAAER